MNPFCVFVCLCVCEFEGGGRVQRQMAWCWLGTARARVYDSVGRRETVLLRACGLGFREAVLPPAACVCVCVL